MAKSLLLETGCYIDGHNGIYSIERLNQLANDLVSGYENSKRGFENRSIVSHSLYGDIGSTITLENGDILTVENCHEISSELYDELTDLLPADEGYVWIWNDGELFYWEEPKTDDEWFDLVG